MKLQVQTTVRAPLADVWRAYTTPEDMMRWNTTSENWRVADVMLDLRAGGAFNTRMEDGPNAFTIEGVVLELQAPNWIEYALGERFVRVDFTQEAEAVRVLVVFDAEARHELDKQEVGWQAALESFKRYVETGRPGA